MITRLKRNFNVIALGFLLWELTVLIVSSEGFPHFWIILDDLLNLASTKIFWEDLAKTLWLSFLGLSLGSMIALLLGVFMGLSQTGEQATRGSLNFVRAIPSVVFLPLLIASIGSSARTAVILTTFVATFTFVTYVSRGIADTDRRLIESANLMSLPWISKIIYLYMPSTLSLLGTGIRLTANRAFGTVVAAGIVAGTPGLGAKLYLAETTANVPRVFAYVFVMGFLGVTIYSLFTRLENQLFKWRVSV